MARCSNPACVNGMVVVRGPANTVPPMPGVRRPCRQCNGCGWESCCDGAVGGPDDVTNNPLDQDVADPS